MAIKSGGVLISTAFNSELQIYPQGSRTCSSIHFYLNAMYVHMSYQNMSKVYETVFKGKHNPPAEEMSSSEHTCSDGPQPSTCFYLVERFLVAKAHVSH